MASNGTTRNVILRSADRMRSTELVSNAATCAIRATLGRSQAISDWCVHHLPRVGSATVVTPTGVAFTLRSPGHHEIPNRLYWRGAFGYEPETSRVMFEVFRDCQFFVDVGANVGYFSALALAANPSMLVASFEPMPRNFAALCQNLAESFPESAALPMRIALSDRSGQVEMQHAGHAVQVRSSIARGQATDLTERLSVTSVRFDELGGLFRKPVDVVKIDVEGSEDLVIEGMAATIRRDQPVICAEVLSESAGEKVREALEGYTPFAIVESGLRPIVGTWRRRQEERNFLWVPPRRHDAIASTLALGEVASVQPAQTRATSTSDRSPVHESVSEVERD